MSTPGFTCLCFPGAAGISVPNPCSGRTRAARGVPPVPRRLHWQLGAELPAGAPNGSWQCAPVPAPHPAELDSVTPGPSSPSPRLFFLELESRCGCKSEIQQFERTLCTLELHKQANRASICSLYC